MARILVVDDTKDSADVLRWMLLDCVPEHEVDAVYSGEDCLEAYTFAKFHARPYDMLIIDLAMPFMNGFEVEAKIWGLGDHTTRVAFLTALIDDLETNRDSYSRVVGVWQKPLTRNEICELVNAALHRQLPTDLRQWVKPHQRFQVQQLEVELGLG